MKFRRESIPGSGLPAAAFLFLIVASVGLFFVWNGLLWKAPREASHGMRFTVSYLSVLPMAALLLAMGRRFSWGHLLTTTGLVWTIKLTITACIYEFVARGTATNLQAVAPPAAAIEGQRAPMRPDYRGEASFVGAPLEGRVLRDGKGVAGAVVFLDAPVMGRPVPASQVVDVRIAGSRYEQSLYLVHVDDAVRLINRDAVLHTAHVYGPGRIPTRPLPASPEPRSLGLTEPGVYRVRCDTHAHEETWVVVVDHPYAAVTGSDGTYRFEGAPAGEARLVAIAGAHRLDTRANVPASGVMGLDLDLSSARDLVP